MTTGLYPVRAEDTDSCCSGCDHPFVLGEFYVYRALDTLAVVNRPADGAIVSPYCVGCGAIPTEAE